MVHRLGPRQVIGAAVALVLVASIIPVFDSWGRASHRPVRRFSVPLPIPKVIRADGGRLTIQARAASLRIFRGEKTRAWTYGGTFPGPTIKARSGRRIRVRFVNKLPRRVGSISTHFHGDNHSSKDDGQPTRYLIPRGRGRTYTYPLTFDGRPERAAFLWYHDHRMGTTGRNIWKGLAGMFVLKDRFERRLPLPKGRYDVPLMLTDRSFDDRNRMPYPESAHNPPPADAAVGDHVLVNGAPAPFFKVRSRRYRLRILNASNFSVYNLRLDNGPSLVQVAGGQGLLPRPVRRESILLGPAQRAEVIVNFRGLRGERIVLESVPRLGNNSGTQAWVGPVMQFRVGRHGSDPTRVPRQLRPRPRWVGEAPEMPSMTWAFGRGIDLSGRQAWTINGRTFDSERVDTEVELGSIETWEFANVSNVSHLVHLHGVPFAVLWRNGSPPPPWEAGLEDTVQLDPGEVVRVAAKFPDYTGPFIIHCHMLEHEDHGMMAQYEVVDSG